MAFLRELVGTVTFAADRDTTFVELLAVIEALGLRVEDADKDKAQVVVRCLTQAANLLFWRCWSDKLLFAVAGGKDGRTAVNVYAIPNLLRVGVAKTENISDAGRIVEAVKEKALHR